MAQAERLALLKQIQEERDSVALMYVTSDRPGMESQISNDAFDFFVQHLDRVWPQKKITFILHTGGGNTAAAWRIINLLRIHCDDLEVLIPNRAHSAGTLMSLGANRIIMTKQATLGPIDPSLSGPLSPQVPGQPNQRVPVSVEAVQGYIDMSKEEIGIADESVLGNIVVNLSQHVHPLVLGQIFRSRTQIRSLAENLLEHQDIKEGKKSKIINFLCSESGSHDRTIDRREAREFGLTIEKPSEELYQKIRDLYEDFVGEMKLRQRFDPMLELGGAQNATYGCVRVLIESVDGGTTSYVTRGEVKDLSAVQTLPNGQQVTVQGAENKITFEGWEQS